MAGNEPSLLTMPNGSSALVIDMPRFGPFLTILI
jgi:hypothetical protein